MQRILGPLAGLLLSFNALSSTPTAEDLAAQRDYLNQDYFEGFPVDQHPYAPLIQRETGYHFRDMSGFPMMIDHYTAVESTGPKREDNRFGYYDIVYIMIPEGARMQDCSASRELIDLSMKTATPYHAIFPSFAPNLICHFEKFYHDQLALKPKGARAKEIVSSERSFIEAGPSMIIAITAENDLSNIYAVGRVVHRGQDEANQQLDIENRLGKKLPKIPVKLREGPIGSYFEGGWAELKSLVRAKQSPEKFIPMLFASAFNVRAHRGIGNAMGRSPGYPLPDHFVTEAFDSMEKIHRSWGMRPLLGYSDAETSVSYSNLWNLEGLMSGMMFQFDPQPFSIVNTRRIEGWSPFLVTSPEQMEQLRAMKDKPAPHNLRVAGELIDCQGWIEYVDSQNGKIPFYQELKRKDFPPGY